MAAALESGAERQMGMSKYRSKPVVIDAIRWDGGNVADLREFFDAFLDWRFNGWDGVEIATLEGTMVAGVGDWIIKGLLGEFYPCKDEVFRKKYEPIDSAASPEPRETPE